MKRFNNSYLLPTTGNPAAVDCYAPSQHPLHRQGPHIRCTRRPLPPVTEKGSIDWRRFCLTCCAFVSSAAKSMEDLKRLLLLILGCAVQVTQTHTHTPAHMCSTATKTPTSAARQTDRKSAPGWDRLPQRQFIQK